MNVQDAEHFLEVGALSWSDWKTLDDAERAAFVAASRRLAAKRAAQIGTATQGIEQALAVYADVDGGKLHDQFLMQQVAKQCRTLTT